MFTPLYQLAVTMANVIAPSPLSTPTALTDSPRRLGLSPLPPTPTPRNHLVKH